MAIVADPFPVEDRSTPLGIAGRSCTFGQRLRTGPGIHLSYFYELAPPTDHRNDAGKRESSKNLVRWISHPVILPVDHRHTPFTPPRYALPGLSYFEF